MTLQTTEGAIALKIPASAETVGTGLAVLRALPTPQCEAVGPFVFLDHIGPERPPAGGVPPHPHAGIEIITYLLQGSNDHRDSLGNHSRIESGGAQWICSGRGLIHAEYPRGDDSGVIHGVQLWTRQPAAQDSAEPRYASAAASAFPRAGVERGVLRLLCGDVAELFSGPGPIRLASEATLLHLTLDAGGSATLPLKKSHETALYTLSGVAEVDGVSAARGEFAVLAPSSAVTIVNKGPGTLELLALGGKPAERPLFFRGPFVFNARESADRAYADFASGRMGSLDGVPF